jgi:predicted esterase
VLAAMVALLLLVGRPVCAQQADMPKDPASWAQAIADLDTTNPQWYGIVNGLANLDFRTSFDILSSCWSRIRNTDVRKQLLSQLAHRQDPFILKLLHLGATDSSLLVQNHSLALIQSYAFRNYAYDYAAYLDWHARHGDQDVDIAMRESLHDLVARLNSAPDEERARLTRELAFADLNDYGPALGSSNGAPDVTARRRKMFEDSGIRDAIGNGLLRRNPPEVIQASLQALRSLRPSEAFLRQYVVPLIDPLQAREIRWQALSLLATPDNKWLAPVLMKQMLEIYPDAVAMDLLQPLMTIADPEVIPTLIAMIVADGTVQGASTLGNVVGQMVGVPYDGSHDADWWRAWWTRNRMRFGPILRDTALPKVTVRKRAAGAGMDPRNMVVVQARRVRDNILHRIGNDPGQSYTLIVPPGTQPGAGEPHDSDPGLLVVLPGGDGNGATVAPFWTEVAQQALKGRYIVALAVAPQRREDQPAVWLTREDAKHINGVTLTAEQLAGSIVRDVCADYRIRRDRIFLHGVSDSGPAVYATSLDANTPFRGFYILSSKFSSTQLPPLKAAKGRRYLIQHSQDDRVAPYWMAAAAQKLLSAQGAVVKLLPYQGNNGYNFSDDPFPHMAKAVEWLEGSQAAAKK